MIVSGLRLLVTGLALLSVSACQGLSGQPSPTATQASATPASAQTCGDNLTYMYRLSDMNSVARQAELDRLDRRLDADNSACPVLQLAIFLSWPDPQFQSDSQAARLLRKAMRMGSLSLADQAFAGLLYSHVSQRQALRNSIGSLDKKFRNAEEERALLSQTVTRLQSQLDQLTALEKSLQEKQEAVPAGAVE